MTFRDQSEWFISVQHSYTTLKVIYDIGSWLTDSFHHAILGTIQVFCLPQEDHDDDDGGGGEKTKTDHSLSSVLTNQMLETGTSQTTTICPPLFDVIRGLSYKAISGMTLQQRKGIFQKQI